MHNDRNQTTPYEKRHEHQKPLFVPLVACPKGPVSFDHSLTLELATLSQKSLPLTDNNFHQQRPRCGKKKVPLVNKWVS